MQRTHTNSQVIATHSCKQSQLLTFILIYLYVCTRWADEIGKLYWKELSVLTTSAIIQSELRSSHPSLKPKGVTQLFQCRD